MKNNLQSTLNWDIRQETLMLSGTINSGKKAILRNDTNQLLGVVGQNYEPITNGQLLHLIDKFCKIGEFTLEGFHELNDGKIILAFLKGMPAQSLINGCENEEYLFIGNSFDGSKRFHVGTASTLVRCSNQFMSTLKIFSKKHISLLNMTELEAQVILKKYGEKKDLLFDSFNALENVKVDEKLVNQLISEVYRLLNTGRTIKTHDWQNNSSMIQLQDAIDREMKDLGNNAFALFNGVTWYTTHKLRSNNAIYSQMNGTAYRINQKAYRFCQNLKRKKFNLKIQDEPAY